MTDPRAALADDLSRDIWHLGTDWSEYRRDLVREGVRRAAERGVLLVTEASLHAALWTALSDSGAVRIDADSPKESGDIARAIFAALSEKEE